MLDGICFDPNVGNKSENRDLNQSKTVLFLLKGCCFRSIKLNNKQPNRITRFCYCCTNTTTCMLWSAVSTRAPIINHNGCRRRRRAQTTCRRARDISSHFWSAHSHANTDTNLWLTMSLMVLLMMLMITILYAHRDDDTHTHMLTRRQTAALRVIVERERVCMRDCARNRNRLNIYELPDKLVRVIVGLIAAHVQRIRPHCQTHTLEHAHTLECDNDDDGDLLFDVRRLVRATTNCCGSDYCTRDSGRSRVPRTHANVEHRSARTQMQILKTARTRAHKHTRSHTPIKR